MALGAASFVGIFHYRLQAVPAAAYENRDDAVVTLSHARNLVEYGFIGVSPSGERVEGLSAPLQFWVAAGAYALTRFDYPSFFRWQVSVGTLALGLVFGCLLLWPRSVQVCWPRFIFVVCALVLSALILASSRAFLLWHASGMENPYKVVLLLALLWGLDVMLRVGRTPAIMGVIVVAAALSRIDAIVPVALLLTAFAGLWWLRYRNGRGLGFAGMSLIPWLLFMSWRYWYFGQWEPNTGIAQSISISGRLAALVQSPGKMAVEDWQWLADVGRSLHAFQFAWLPIAVLLVRRERAALERGTLLCAGGLACLLQYVLFGQARMDPARTVSELAAFGTLAVPFVLTTRKDFGWQIALVGLLMLSASGYVATRTVQDQKPIGWSARSFERMFEITDQIARDFDIPRPTLANPDLGAVSWYKRVNVLDIGRLGSAVIPRLENPSRYLVEFAKPDIIESHDSWSCRYRALFESSTFKDEYAAVRSERTDWLNANCSDAPAALNGYWIRRAVLKNSGTRERIFLDAFRSRLDIGSAKAELAQCVNIDAPDPCAYVGRTLFRFVPELKSKGLYAEVAHLLKSDSRLRNEHAVFTSSTDPLWWRRIVASVEPVSSNPARVSLFTFANGEHPLQAQVELRNPAKSSWRLTNPAPDLLDLQPTAGTGNATLVLRGRLMPSGTDKTVSIPIYADTDTTPASTLTVRLRSLSTIGLAMPFGAINVPDDPVQVENSPVVFQGWALDDFNLRRVEIIYVDRTGRIGSLGDTHGIWMRPDLPPLFPNAHDLFNSGWVFTLFPEMLAGLPRPVTLHFYAESGDNRRKEIGARTIR